MASSTRRILLLLASLCFVWHLVLRWKYHRQAVGLQPFSPFDILWDTRRNDFSLMCRSAVRSSRSQAAACVTRLRSLTKSAPQSDQKGGWKLSRAEVHGARHSTTDLEPLRASGLVFARESEGLRGLGRKSLLWSAHQAIDNNNNNNNNNNSY